MQRIRTMEENPQPTGKERIAALTTELISLSEDDRNELARLVKLDF